MHDEQLDSAAANDPTMPSDSGRPRADSSRADSSRAIRTQQSRQGTRGRSLRAQWREEFPYHWSADDVVTRRDTLRFLVAGTGALALATGALALAGSIATAPTKPLAIARVGELGFNQSKVFNFPDQFAQGILINLPGVGLLAYSDVCTHLSCAVLYQGDGKHLYCPCHEGLFDVLTGDVLGGPPTRPLPLIDIIERNGLIYALRTVER